MALKESVRWNVRLLPLANVQASDEAGGVWESSGNDPQFALSVTEPAGGTSTGEAATPGWHLFEMQVNATEGSISAPCLYPDYGEGASEATRIRLPVPDAQGVSRKLVYILPGLRALRLDPSDRDARFTIRASLLAVGRMRGMLHMLRVLWEKNAEDPEATGGRLLKEWSGDFLRNGPTAWRRHVHARYNRALHEEAPSYRAWLRRNEPRLSQEQVQARVDALPARPVFSIVMPVYQPPEQWLRRALDSVLAQHYPDWELCISDDASPSDKVRKVLAEYAARDARIRVVYRKTNGHISESSNSALELATGDYMALLDHDDELHPEALLVLAETLASRPDARILYSDEDKMDERGNRFAPYFKPDWNYDLFLGQNCISHLGAYHLPLVREAGGFAKGMEGSQDWDLALRCIEKVDAAQIVHVPRVLYHWRAIAGSTALASDQKNYAILAGQRAVAAHLARMSQKAEVSILPSNLLRVKRALPPDLPRVSLVIPTRDKVGLLKTCVESIFERSTYPDFEVLVVDNGSVEAETFEYFSVLSERKNARVLNYPGVFNYSAINNFAVRQASGDVIGLINNDIEVISPDWMEEMVSLAIRPDAGAVGAMLYYPDDTIQHAGVLVGVGGIAGHIGSHQPRGSAGYFGRMFLTQQLSAVTAACLLVRKSVYDEVDGLDEQLKVAFNDVDFCLRLLKAGYRNLWTPFAELYHHESASRGLEDNPEKMARFMSEIRFMQERWGNVLAGDPAYNPNLSMEAANFALA